MPAPVSATSTARYANTNQAINRIFLGTPVAITLPRRSSIFLLRTPSISSQNIHPASPPVTNVTHASNM